jgi:SAM-dependent methyltransferase
MAALSPSSTGRGAGRGRPGRGTLRAMDAGSTEPEPPSPDPPKDPPRDPPPVGLDYSRLYEFRFKDVDQHKRQVVWNEIARYLWNRMGRPRRVLDPAGGRGEFVNAVPAEERWLVDVVDYPERQTDPRVRIVIGNLFEIELPDSYFDAVFASNLLEHFHSPEEVAAFLDRMRGTLAPGGVLALMSPNFKYCVRDYFDCADHILALTHVSVQELLFAAGYSVTDVVPRFLPFSFRSRLSVSPLLTRFYLRMPILWPLQGKQFLILAKPA